jgi:hypothetical protein
MALQGRQHDDELQAAQSVAEEEEHETHEPPRGALLLTFGYLLVIVSLWMQVYLQLLSNGGVPRP